MDNVLILTGRRVCIIFDRYLNINLGDFNFKWLRLVSDGSLPVKSGLRRLFGSVNVNNSRVGFIQEDFR